MRKAFGKLKAFLPQEPKGRASPPPVPPPVGAGHLPKGYYVEVDKYRYRKHRGVNLGELCVRPSPSRANVHLFGTPLGSWFVLERWISESPFRNARPPAQSDLDVAKGEGAKGILEQHWDTWITEDDWLAEKGINTVRIPVCLRSSLPLLPLSLLYLPCSKFCTSRLPYTPLQMYSVIADPDTIYLDWLLSHLWYRSKHPSRNRLRRSLRPVIRSVESS